MAKRTNTRPYVETVLSFLYPTTDDWHPNCERNTVQVMMHVYMRPRRPDGPFSIKLGVTGADDTCMARYESVPQDKFEERVKELKFWLEHKLPNPLTQEWLLAQGFNFD